MPATGTRQPVTIQYRDYAGKLKSLPDIFSGEITALTIAGFLTALGALETALDAVTLGVRATSEWGAKTTVSNDFPASENARRETELLVQYVDAVNGTPYSTRIPTVDYAAFNYASYPAGDTVIIAGDGASDETVALIDAMEALLKAPNDDSHGITVVGMKVVR